MTEVKNAVAANYPDCHCSPRFKGKLLYSKAGRNVSSKDPPSPNPVLSDLAAFGLYIKELCEMISNFLDHGARNEGFLEA